MFKITIEEIKTVREMVGNVWGVIGTKEVEREQRYYGTDEKEPKTRIEDVHGYLPPVERSTQVKSTLLTQEVESLGLSKVIKAINNL